MTTDFDLDTDLDAEIDEPGPEISMTDPAIARLLHLIESAGDPPVTGIRLQVARRAKDGIEPLLTMVDQGGEPEDDYELDFDGLAIYVHGDHAEDLDGLAVHWGVQGRGRQRLRVRQPQPALARSAGRAHPGAVRRAGQPGDRRTRRRRRPPRRGGQDRLCPHGRRLPGLRTGERHPARGHRGHDERSRCPRSKRSWTPPTTQPARTPTTSPRPATATAATATASRAESSLSFVCGGLRPPHPHPGRARALCSC